MVIFHCYVSSPEGMHLSYGCLWREPTKLARFAILLLSTWRATQVFLFAQLQIWSCWNFISKSMASMDIHAVSIVSNYQYYFDKFNEEIKKCHYVPTYQTDQSWLIYFAIFWPCLHPYAAHKNYAPHRYRSDPWEDVPWDPLAAASIWTMKTHSKSPRWAGHWAIKTLFKMFNA